MISRFFMDKFIDLSIKNPADSNTAGCNMASYYTDVICFTTQMSFCLLCRCKAFFDNQFDSLVYIGFAY